MVIAPGLKHSVDHDGIALSIKQAAELVGMSEPSTRNYVVTHGCKTIKEIIARRDSPRYIRDPRFKKHNTTKGLLTIDEIIAKHKKNSGVSEATIRGRIVRRGSECPSLWYPKLTPHDFRTRLIKEKLISPPEKEDRNYGSGVKVLSVSIQRKTCAVEGTICKHYSACTDSTCFRKTLPRRYRKDKSCYEASTPKPLLKKTNDGIIYGGQKNV